MMSFEVNPLWLEIGLPALAVGLLLGALVVWLLGRRRLHQFENQIDDLNDNIKSQEALQHEREAAFQAASGDLARSFSELANKSLQSNSENFLRLAEQKMSAQNERAKRDLGDREKAVADLVKPIRDTLQASQKQISDLEKARSEAYGSIRTQLESMQADQKSLTQETQNLVKALRRPEVRGRWGEITLRRLVELAGMVEHCDFQEQVHNVGDDQVIRPDMIVRMPDRRELVVDVKTPLDAYLEAVEAKDDAQRKLGLERHTRNIREHIRTLSSKAYWAQFSQSPEFVILFIPGDQFLSAALSEDPELIEFGVSKRVILATPTTLIALLRAVSYGWRQDQISEHAEKIGELGRTLFERLRILAGHFDDLRKNLDRSVESYNKAAGSFESRVLVTARKFQEIDPTIGDTIPELGVIDKTARRVINE